ncbi:MAG: hypothetical protein FWG65_11080 [Turicibacter sp.]|nr:hypothetical protein [Turicibacter sp.]
MLYQVHERKRPIAEIVQGTITTIFFKIPLALFAKVAYNENISESILRLA